MNQLIKKAKESGKFTRTEMRFIRHIFSGMVLNLIGAPGIGKSAIINSIANKMDALLKEDGLSGFNLISIPLPSYDETDISGLPYLEQYGEVKVYKHGKPEWAILANEMPTVIFFDEANRSRQQVKNAVMKVIYERCIDYEFEFNNTVFFVLAGNKGEEDGTIVEEFDSSFKGRLVTIDFFPTVSEWIEDFARNNVNPHIVSFVENKPSHYYDYNEEAYSYASPRSWTRLSQFIRENCENPQSIDEMLELSADFSAIVGGKSANEFIVFLQERNEVSIEKIVTNFAQYEELIKDYNRSQLTGLGKDLLQMENHFIRNNVEGVTSFLSLYDQDSFVAFLHEFVQSYVSKLSPDNEDLSDTFIKNLIKKAKGKRQSQKVDYE